MVRSVRFTALNAARGILAILLVVSASVLILRVLSRLSKAPPSPAMILPDDGGAIAEVVCAVNSARRSPLRNASLVAAIVNALPSAVHVTILTNDREAFQVAHDPAPGRVGFLDLPGKLDFTIWPQDPFLVLAGPSGPCLLSSAEFERFDDRAIAQALAQYRGWPLRPSRLVFEGGNLVAGTRHVFIGANTIAENGLRQNTTPEQIVRQFQQELGRPVVVAGPMPQPVAHIDMMLTVLDAHRIALADPRWGARLARRRLDRERFTVTRFEQSCEDLYFGDPQIHQVRGPPGTVLRPLEVIGQTARAVERAEAMAAHLDRLAEELVKFDYRIERVPFLPGIDLVSEKPASRPSTQPAATLPARKPGYPTLTYNNVLTETLPRERVVYLPQYGWEALDRAGREAWEKIGYRVVPVANFAISSLHGGSLRCCVKVLRRS